MESRSKTVFDHVNGLTSSKIPWDTLNELDKKTFTPYIINRIFSMDFDLIEVINYLQPYTIGLLNSREVYKLYSDLFPKRKLYNKYIKADKDENKISDQLIDLLCKEFHWNEQECVSNLKFISTPDLIEFFKDRGYTDSEIKKFKLK